MSSCLSQLMSIVFFVFIQVDTMAFEYDEREHMSSLRRKRPFSVIQSSAFGSAGNDDSTNNKRCYCNNTNSSNNEDNATRNRILFEAVIQIQTTLSPNKYPPELNAAETEKRNTNILPQYRKYTYVFSFVPFCCQHHGRLRTNLIFMWWKHMDMIHSKCV